MLEKEQHMQDFVPGKSQKDMTAAQGNSLFFGWQVSGRGDADLSVLACETIREAFVLVWLASLVATESDWSDFFERLAITNKPKKKMQLG